jgi:tetratricopeptide (TPR) repeat protein
MPRIHPRADVVQDLVEGLGGAERSLLLHVLDCAVCRGLLRERLNAAGQAAGRPAPRAVARVLSWRRRSESGCPVDSVLRRFRGRLHAIEREQAEAPVRLAELLRCPAGRRAALLRAAPRFHTLSLCHRLAAASHEECFRDPRAAEEVAGLGLELASLLDPLVYGARLLADARLRCWAAVGNARRIAADLRGADRAFAAARELLQAGTRDRLERARLFALEASLRRAERRLDEADALLRRAIAIYRQAGERHLQGEAILAQALVRRETGEPEPAIALLQQADRLIDPRRNPRLELCLRHNLAHWLTEAGRYLEARAVIARSRDLYERFPDRPSQLRRLWVEGKVAAGLGLWDEAAGLFERVRDGFAAEPLPYDAALAGLDLAVAWSRLGRTAEVRALAAEVLPLFRARELQRETLAALLVLEHAAAAEGASLTLLEEATARLRAQAGGSRREPVPFDL